MYRFEVFQGVSGDWRFRMRASNGEIILSSESYTRKHSCLSGIKSIKANAARAEVVEVESKKKEISELEEAIQKKKEDIANIVEA